MSSEAALAPAYGYTWAFVALQYYALIWNRITLVLVGPSIVSAAYMGGPVAAMPYPATAWDPGYWLADKHLRRYAGINVGGPEFLAKSIFNRQWPRSDVRDVRLDMTPKWGMGGVPYSGRIHVGWANQRTTEFILLGRQDGRAIRDRLMPVHQAVVASDPVPAPVFDPFGAWPKPASQQSVV